MPRYIDADALKAKYEQMLPEIGDGYHKETLQDVLFELDYAPTVSPDEVRGAGKWVKREKVRPNLPDDSDYEFECSCCGWRDLHNAKMIVPYCWHCGAKMEVTSDA